MPSLRPLSDTTTLTAPAVVGAPVTVAEVGVTAMDMVGRVAACAPSAQTAEASSATADGAEEQAAVDTDSHDSCLSFEWLRGPSRHARTPGSE